MAPPIARSVSECRDVEANTLTQTRTMNLESALTLMLVTFIVIIISGVLSKDDDNRYP
jgi:hypothetical protein